MSNRMNYLMKNTGILTISNFSSKILVFLLVPLYTSVLTTEEYGTYDLIISTVTLVYPVITLNIADAVMRFSMDRNYDKKKVASIGFRYIVISFFLVLVFAVIMKNIHIVNDWSNLLLYIVLYYISYVLNQYFIQLAKGLERVSDMAVAGVISTITMLGGNILLLLAFKMRLEGFFLASILAQIIPAIYFVIRMKFWEILNFTFDVKLQKEMLLYSVPLIATVVGWWVNSTADKFVVTFILGISANGLLSVSYKIPQIINTLQGIFVQAWQISAIKEYGERDTAKFYGNTFTVVNLLMCIACSLLVFLTKPLAHILYAKDFYVAWQFVPFLLISSVLNCASGLLGPILSAQKNSKAMMWSALIGAVSNIIMNIVLVKFIGVQGATVATLLCSYIIYAVRKKAVGKEIEIDRYPIILLTWGLLFVQAIVENYLSNYMIEAIVMVILFAINIHPIKKLFGMGRNMVKHIRK
ncbi:MAG: oligosaccharide flippase family protein [Lachnospiraceae bacterium]